MWPSVTGAGHFPESLQRACAQCPPRAVRAADWCDDICGTLLTACRAICAEHDSNGAWPAAPTGLVNRVSLWLWLWLRVLRKSDSGRHCEPWISGPLCLAKAIPSPHPMKCAPTFSPIPYPLSLPGRLLALQYTTHCSACFRLKPRCRSRKSCWTLLATSWWTRATMCRSCRACAPLPACTRA